jgi:chromosome segregation protein
VRLTTLTLQGFKSFGNRTAIEFSPGVTAVVGPNGSGKSNLLDALKWVTGGGRAREFRAETRTDLIFHGAAGKRGVGFAEVEVELSDGRRSIKVRRDLDRSGASRLRLDGRVARFLDVDEALAGSGLGTAGVAMIGQGEVAGVLMADPTTLLRYVAEAAGVARLASRREQTQSRLDAARSHLTRLEDVLVELRERIEHLRHEAQVATRHTELTREALALRVTAGHARVASLEAEVGALRQEVGAAEQRILEGRERLAVARAAVEEARGRRTEAERTYREALAAAERAQGVLALARAGVQRAAEGRSSALRAQESAAREAASLAAMPEPKDPEVDLAALQRRVDDAEAAVAESLELRAAAEAELERVRAGLEAAREREAQAQAAWSAYRARSAALDEEHASLSRERERLRAEEPGPDVDALAAAREGARGAVVDAEAALDAARRDLQLAHELHATAHGESVAATRSAQQARAAYEARRGYAQGPRVALTSGIAGVHGSVADLLRVAPEHRAAIAGALGRRAEYVVVDTAETAARVLAAVRAAGGWVTLLPLDLLRPPRADADGDRGIQGLLGRAADVVDVAPEFRAVVAQLLANTWLVEDLAIATAIARRHADRPRLVTLEGDVLEAGGAISGGRRTGGATVLGLGRDLERAERDAAVAEERVATALADRTAAQERVREIQSRAGDLRRHAEDADAAWRAADAQRERKAERLAAIDAREARWRATREELVAPERSEDDGDAAAWAAAELEARSTVAEARAVTEATLAEAAEARREAEVGGERLLAFEAARIAHRQALERAERLRAESASHGEEVARWRVEETAAQARREAAEAALPRDVDARRRAFEGADEAQQRAEATLRQHTEGQARAGDALETARLALARREAALELALDERAALPTGVEPLALSERVARARWREVEAALEALGPVNQRAAIDHASQAERLSALEDEGAQAAEAVAELAGTLATIDAETTGRLNTALKGLQEGFAEHVRQLFGPTALGSVDVEREGERPVGVRIRLQPPGKRTESLNLLSVGERTMGAMAFLFALMAGDIGSLPIAVLDEVDAPLDEANIRRFCGFIEALSSRGTQFILITHQKATFEVADTLWGVTSDDGVSRVFSIRREAPNSLAGVHAREP